MATLLQFNPKDHTSPPPHPPHPPPLPPQAHVSRKITPSNTATTSSTTSFSTCCEVDDGGGGDVLLSDEEDERNNGTVVADDVEFISNPGKHEISSGTFTKTSTCKSDKSSKSTLTHKRSSKSFKSYSLKTWYRAIGKSKWSSPLTSLYLTINHRKKKNENGGQSSSSSSEEEERGRAEEYSQQVPRRRSSTSNYSDDENKVTINVYGEGGPDGDSPQGSDKSIVFVGGEEGDRIVYEGACTAGGTSSSGTRDRRVYGSTVDLNNNRGRRATEPAVASGTYRKDTKGRKVKIANL